MSRTLSVVIPYYNEPDWLAVAVDDVLAAVAASPLELAEIIVVDDGSGEEGAQAAHQVISSRPGGLLVRQENAGRFAARMAGLNQATGELVLLIDSRVSIDRDALAFAATRIDAGDTPIWNAHVRIDLGANPLPRFWNILTEEAYAHYFRDPRTTTYAVEDFDLYPKGTTCFLAPRTALLEAFGRFAKRHEAGHLANDDTPIIRDLAAQTPIGISPSFGALYRSRTSLDGFLRHAYHRGTVFVDGHAVAGGRFLPVILAFYPSSVGAVVLLARRPRLGLRFAAAALATLIAGVLVRRRSPADAAALGFLAPPFGVAFGAGMWRGARVSVRARLRW